MKKLFPLLLLLLVVQPAWAGGQKVAQSTATRVTLKWVDATDGVTPETAYTTVGNAVCTLVKHDQITATTLTLTASGGSNDSAFISNGVAYLELTAANTDTIGRLDLYCTCGSTCITGGAAPFEAHYTVSAASDPDFTGNFASVADMADGLMNTVYEGTTTFKYFLQYGSSALFGKYSRSGDTFNFRDIGDSKNRIVYTTTSTSRATVTLSPD